ncbi:MAG: ArgE/DapE family deacylase [Bryobacteraceae bacterium]
MTPRIDKSWLFDTLADLIRIDSVNPTLVPGGAGERAAADYVARAMALPGVRVEQFEPEPGRVSVLATLPGTGGGRSLMLNGHIDTVGIEGMEEPFSAAMRDGKMFGRGGYDMKGSVAACMSALRTLALSDSKLRGDVMVAAVSDEEYGSLGTADLIMRVKPDGAIVTEPTNLQVCMAHKGYLWIEVVTHGKAAHGSKFDQGVDANMRMGRFLAELDGLEKDLRARTPHPLIGPPSLHAALLKGGEGLSTYSPSCTLHVERRTIPGETEAQAVAEIQAIVDRLASADDTFRATVRCFFARDPFEVAREAAIVQALANAATPVIGREPNFIGDTPWMDSALLSAAGTETVVFGPGGGGAHASVEWVELDTVAHTAQILLDTAIGYCS